MAVRPEFVTCGETQLRVWRCGVGMDILVLPGLHQGAASRARQLAVGAGGLGIVVVDMMSAFGMGGSVVETAAWIARHLAPYGFPRVIVAYDRAEGLALALRDSLGKPDLPILSIEDSRREQKGVLERLLPCHDGSHLVSMWQHLRDMSILDGSCRAARKEGSSFPSNEDLHDSLLEFAERPELYVHAWRTLEATTVPDNTGHWKRLTGLDGLWGRIPGAPSAPLPVVEPARLPGDGRQYVSTSSGYFHVRRYGKAGEAVVILQSAPGSALPMAAVGSRLGRKFQAYCPDLLGNGESSKPERTPDIPTLAREIVELADALSLERFHLVGTHTGAKIALSIAEQFPDRVDRIILDGLSLMRPEMRADVLENYLPPLELDRWGTHVLHAWNMRRDMFLFWPWYRQTFAAARTIGVPAVEDLHEWTIGLLQSGVTYDQSYRAAFLCDATGLLPKVRHPVLLAVGPFDMFARDLDAARELLPSGSQVCRTECTAWYPGQIPEAVGRTVLAFERFLSGEPKEREING